MPRSNDNLHKEANDYNWFKSGPPTSSNPLLSTAHRASAGKHLAILAAVPSVSRQGLHIKRL